MSPDRAPRTLRRAVLAATLTDPGVLGDLQTREEGLLYLVEPLEPLEIGWGELLVACGDPLEALAERTLLRRVTRWLRLRVALHVRADNDGPEALRDWVLSRVRPRALPADHELHPGATWVQREVLGGALDVGLALRGIDDDGRPSPEDVGLLPAPILTSAGIELALATDRADRYLDDMAMLAAERLRRDPSAVLRSLGDADVLTLLASATFRTALVDGQGMRSAAIPARTRGWLDLGRLDPAFALSAALLTEPDQRGFPRPVLVTADEVTLVRAGGDVVGQSLADPVTRDPHRPVTRLA